MRHDYQIAKCLEKRYGKAYADEWRRTPLFLIDVKNLDYLQDHKWMTSKRVEGLGPQGITHIPMAVDRSLPDDARFVDMVASAHNPGRIESVLPFTTFIVYFSGDLGITGSHETPGCYRLTYLVDTDEWVVELVYANMMLIANNGDERALAKQVAGISTEHLINARLKYDTENDSVSVGAESTPFRKARILPPPNASKHLLNRLNGKLGDVLVDDADNRDYSMLMFGVTQIAIAYFMMAEERRMVSVRQCTKKLSANKRRKIEQTTDRLGTHSTCHYIYLDQPPAEALPASSGLNGESTPRRGHKRRKHWRTLSHPRFRNHPKYGQRIRVKESWVGSTTWVVDDSIYTVHLEDSDNE